MKLDGKQDRQFRHLWRYSHPYYQLNRHLKRREEIMDFPCVGKDHDLLYHIDNGVGVLQHSSVQKWVDA